MKTQSMSLNLQRPGTLIQVTKGTARLLLLLLLQAWIFREWGWALQSELNTCSCCTEKLKKQPSEMALI